MKQYGHQVRNAIRFLILPLAMILSEIAACQAQDNPKAGAIHCPQPEFDFGVVTNLPGATVTNVFTIRKYILNCSTNPVAMNAPLSTARSNRDCATDSEPGTGLRVTISAK